MNNKTKLTIAAYNKHAAQFALKFMDLTLYKNNLLQFINLLPTAAKIIDLGCGPGNVARLLVDQQKNFQITGIDLSQTMIDLAKRNVPQSTFILGDMRDLSLLPHNNDAVIAAFAIVHLSDAETQRLIRQSFELLNSSGYFYISCIEGSRKGWETSSFSGQTELYFNRYSQQFIIRTLQSCGFMILDSYRQNYPEQDGTISTELFFHARKP